MADRNHISVPFDARIYEPWRILRTALVLVRDILRAHPPTLAMRQHDRADHRDEQGDTRCLEQEDIARLEKLADLLDIALVPDDRLRARRKVDHAGGPRAARSEERRVGKEGVSPWRSRW